ncbi:valine--tRNA ligase [Aeoliella sp. ICT_H6.2]|uniref:Valine--tRNA ligase n=1 Tax=Aeoliella straminimaris TaxID=2954799 RepID=A0A9X2FG98_9BACT|nr:valine--tRNA ligase [Aeoliella straminimaris]MCO6043696.1 valine--tRNA ligase [Aeoliella straminimaris]
MKSLSAQYDHAAAQDKWYPFWEKQGYFHADPKLSQTVDGKPPYTIVIPPPNVTGALHLGHALNNTLQDILIRMKRMQGYNTLWMPGTDHAGIATQAVVERRLLAEEKVSRHDLGREGLVDRIWQWKEQYEKRILGQLKQLGCSCDWERTRFTLDDTCARAVRETFFKLFSDGKIYRGKRLVNWDTYLQTAVSDDEVFHEVVKGHFWHFRYPVIDAKPGEPTHVTIATTRPETMLGDTAVAVHPQPATQLAKVKKELEERLAAAPAKEKPPIEAQLEALAEREKTKLDELQTLAEMAARGVMLKLPLTGRKIPLIADIWAKPELGSGCVKITPAHDANDYEVWQRNQEIGAINILNPEGTLNENVPEKYRGLTMKKAREAVVEDLVELGLHDPETDREDREIDLAHSDRSKTPIEPYLADQWFVKMDQLAQTAMDAVSSGKVRIVPERYIKTYLDWLSEKRDWPVGRQLWWGHRIPVWTRQSTFDGFPEGALGPIIATAEKGVSTHFASDKKSHLTPQNHSVRYEVNEAERTVKTYVSVSPGNPKAEEQLESPSWGYKQDEEVLDTWFSSALWPHSTLGWPEETDELHAFYPTTTLITSRDIITLWVARMVLMGEYNMGEVPFHEVYIHPKILDGFGETMSKSKGNGIDPLDVIQKFGADALRFGIAYLTTETQDVRMPVEFECPHCDALIKQTKKNRILPRIECDKCHEPFSTQWAEKDEDKALKRGAVVSDRFELGRNFCNKVWNASRFSLSNLEDYTPGEVKTEELLLEDRWLLSRLATVTRQVTHALNTYRYADAARTLYDFAWDEFCSFYIEMTKARFDVPEQRATAQRVLAHALDTLLRLLHPITPFLTEEIWQLLNEVAPVRSLTNPDREATESICISPWPEWHDGHVDSNIESQFAEFQAVLGAVREIRSRQNITMKEELSFNVKCPTEVAKRLEAMQPYFAKMANATAAELGPTIAPPDMAASIPLAGDLVGIEVHVDVSKYIDVDAEKKRLTNEEEKLTKYERSIEGKLKNEKFVANAPAEVVEAERDKLADAKKQLVSIRAALQKLAEL